MSGGDLAGWTNGLQDEFFDHQAAYMNVTWDVLDNLTIKYIGAYTDYFYHRTTDDDRTGMPIDQQFYAAQENENFQHELQFFLDVGTSVNLTGGYFYYENDIDQQLDFYSPDGWSRYTEPADYGVLGPTAYLFGAVIVPAWLITGDTSTNHRTAKELGKAGVLPNLAGAVPIPSFSDPEHPGGLLRGQSVDGRHRGHRRPGGPRPGVERHDLHLGHGEPHRGLGCLSAGRMADQRSLRPDPRRALCGRRQGGGREPVPVQRGPGRPRQLRQQRGRWSWLPCAGISTATAR